MKVAGLQTVKRRARLGCSSPKGTAVAPKERKKLTAAEKRTPEGRFAVQLESLMAERGVGSFELGRAIGVKEPTVRAWLRAESLPGDVKLVRRLGKYMHQPPRFPFPDWRQILPLDM